MIKNVFRYISYILPHFVFLIYGRLKEKKNNIIRRNNFESIMKLLPVVPKDLSYTEMFDSLVKLGINREQILAGSIPEQSLLEMFEVVKKQFGKTELFVLHIGNFVGISLVYLARLFVELNSRNHIISIDPNIPHRGIDNPQEKVLYLIDKYGVTKNVSILTGFTLEKNISNDGNGYTSYDPVSKYRYEYSTENQLSILERIMEEKSFSVVLIDGNHEKQYLSREITLIHSLLSESGLLILDDVSDSWKDIKEIYQSSSQSGFEQLYSNDRIGILKKRGS